MKSNKDTRYKQMNCRPDYILEKDRYLVLILKTLLFHDKNLTQMFTLARRVQIMHLNQDKSSSFTADKMVRNFPPNVYEELFITVGLVACVAGV